MLKPFDCDVFVDGLISWLHDNIESFRPPHERSEAAACRELVALTPRRKAFGELGAALRIAGREPKLARRADVQSLRRDWLAMVDAQDVFFDVGRRLGLHPYHVGLWAVCAELAPPGPPHVHRALQRVLSRGYVDRVERNAWNQMDLRYYFDEAALDHAIPTASQLYKESSLARRPELPYVRDIDLYASTHILFDLARFGRVDPLAELGAEAEHVPPYFRMALSMCLAERNWDLTAEILMCRLYMAPPDDLDLWALRSVTAAQHASGFVPGRSEVDGRSDALGFDAVYHSTVVCLFLAAAYARRCPDDMKRMS